MKKLIFSVLLSLITLPLWGADSPTGRNPKLIWSPAQQDIWNQMVANYNANPLAKCSGVLDASTGQASPNSPCWFKYILSGVQREENGNPYNNDHGDFGALAYQMTGNTQYAQDAWNQIQPYAQTDTTFWGGVQNSNGIRITYSRAVSLYDYLYPWLINNPDANTMFLAWLNWMAGATLGTFGSFPGNANGSIGHFAGLGFDTEIATTTDLLSNTYDIHHVATGGLIPCTSCYMDTFRDALYDYAQFSQGGMWLESTEYMPNAERMYLTLWYGMKNFLGKDYFPEISASLDGFAQAYLQRMTPNMADTYEWADDNHQRDLQIYTQIPLAATIQGLLSQDDLYAGYLQEAIYEQLQSPLDFGSGSSPTAWFFYFFNPFATRVDWRDALSKTYYSSGQGFMFYHNGWNPANSFLGLHFPPPWEVNHQTKVIGDFQLYRQGGWAITHPIGYGTELIMPETNNTVSIAGLGSAIMRGSTTGSANNNPMVPDYIYYVGNTNGSYLPANSWKPPQPFLREFTREFLYLPTSDNSSDTLIIYDRVNTDVQTLLATANQYPSSDDMATRISASLCTELNTSCSALYPHGLKQEIFHIPVSTWTVNGNWISWLTPQISSMTKYVNNPYSTIVQQVQLTSLYPIGSIPKFYSDQYDLQFSSAQMNPTEMRWQVRLQPEGQTQNPPQNNDFDSFLNVIQTRNYDPTSKLNFTNRALSQTQGDPVQGAFLHRPGFGDSVVMFGADPNMRIISNGYTVTWKSLGAKTNVYFADLDISKTWSVTLNGSPISSTMDSSGLLHFGFTSKGNTVYTVLITHS